MPIHAPLSLAHLVLAPMLAVTTPTGDVAWLDPHTLDPRAQLPAHATTLFTAGRELWSTEPASDDATGAIVRIASRPKVRELSRSPIDGDARMISARGRGVAVGTIDGGAWIGVLDGPGHATSTPSSVGELEGGVWTFHASGDAWTWDVHPFDGETLGPPSHAASTPPFGTQCGPRVVETDAGFALVVPTEGAVEVWTPAARTRVPSTQPCVEAAVALPGGRVAVLLGPDAEVVATGYDKVWKLGAKLPHAVLPSARLARGLAGDTLFVAVDGPLVELDLAADRLRASRVAASAVVVLR